MSEGGGAEIEDLRIHSSPLTADEVKFMHRFPISLQESEVLRVEVLFNKQMLSEPVPKYRLQSSDTNQIPDVPFTNLTKVNDFEYFLEYQIPSGLSTIMIDVDGKDIQGQTIQPSFSYNEFNVYTPISINTVALDSLEENVIITFSDSVYSTINTTT